MNAGEMFKSEVAQSLHMATINHFEGVFSMAKTSPLPPERNIDIVNINDYRRQFKANPVLYWGINNRFPTDIDAEATMSSVFEGGMKVLCDHLRGQNLFLYNEVWKNGTRTIEEVQDDEVMQELEDIGYFEYWDDACGELPKWGNVWPIFRLNETTREIRLIQLYDGSWNRFQLPQPKTGKIENIYVSAQWPNNIQNSLSGTNGIIPDNLKQWIFQYPLLDRYNYIDEMALMKKNTTFAAHHKYHTSNAVYGRAPWHSLYANRWLGISGKVPEMIIRYYEAAMTINYLFYMDMDWLLKKFPDFDSWGEEQRGKKVKEIQTSFEKNLSGTNNAMKSLMLTFKFDKTSGKEIKNVIIEPLDNKIREGSFIPDSQVSDGQILFTLGLDPSLIGVVVPGGKQTAGSGSNIREASLALQMRLRPDRERNHNAFYIWRDYKFRNTSDKNKKRLKIGTRDYIINTLDQKAPAAAQETTPAN